MIGGTKLVTDLLAFVYPAYMSFKAIDNKAAVSGKDDLQWLTYWVVYAAFALVDRGGEMVLNWIPFYFYFKCAFLVWLYHPKTQGATLVYQQGIRPFVLPYLPKEATTKKAE
jgi:receptor expression-enhancing protein 5/6